MLNIQCSQAHVQPGQWLIWSATWSYSDAKSRKFTATMYWETSGKGDDDWESAIEEQWTSSEAEGRKEFRWIAPRAPVSFASKLIKLSWFIELESSDDKVPIQHRLVVGSSPVPVRV